MIDQRERRSSGGANAERNSAWERHRDEPGWRLVSWLVSVRSMMRGRGGNHSRKGFL